MSDDNSSPLESGGLCPHLERTDNCRKCKAEVRHRLAIESYDDEERDRSRNHGLGVALLLLWLLLVAAYGIYWAATRVFP